MSEQSDELLTPAEVCKMLGGITQKTLCDWNINHRHKKYWHRSVLPQK